MPTAELARSISGVLLELPEVVDPELDEPVPEEDDPVPDVPELVPDEPELELVPEDPVLDDPVPDDSVPDDEPVPDEPVPDGSVLDDPVLDELVPDEPVPDELDPAVLPVDELPEPLVPEVSWRSLKSLSFSALILSLARVMSLLESPLNTTATETRSATATVLRSFAMITK